MKISKKEAGIIAVVIITLSGISFAFAGKEGVPFDEIWSQAYGGPFGESGMCVTKHPYGGYLITGSTSDLDPWWDVIMVRVSENGSLLWSKNIGQLGNCEWGYNHIVSNNSIIVVGIKDVPESNHDFFVVKTDLEGNILWNKTYGTVAKEEAYSVVESSDGNYFVVGNIFQNTVDVLLMKIDPTGELVWNQTYLSENSSEEVSSIFKCSDSGYIISATFTPSGDYVDQDYFLLKIESDGSFLWNKTYGYQGYNFTLRDYPSDYARYAQETSDGGYMVVGFSKSYGAQNYDYMIVKTDSEGNELWHGVFGGEESDYCQAGLQLTNGEYILTGSTNSFGALPNDDVFVVCLHQNGTLKWSSTYGGEQYDGAWAIIEGANSSIVIAGNTESFGHGEKDIYLLKIKEVLSTEETPEPEPALPLKPAEFEFSNLKITPRVEEGMSVTISVDVTNVGEEVGGCTVELKVNGEVVESVDIAAFGGVPPDYDQVTATHFFELTRVEGTYEVEVEGLTGSFTVVKPESSFLDKIPGFPYESIILGLIATIIIIWRVLPVPGRGARARASKTVTE